MDAPNPTIKISFERDYYAVLELAPKTTDVAAIKKQYKKLCTCSYIYMHTGKTG